MCSIIMLDMTDAGQEDDDDDGDDLEKNCESAQLFSTTCVSKSSFFATCTSSPYAQCSN